MGRKLQIGKLSNTAHVVIEDENGVMVATTVGDIDHEKFANEIITAVNVMPIVKKILTVLSSESVGDFVYNIRERAAEDPKCPENSWNHPRVKAWGKACAMIRPVLEKLEGC